VILPSGAQFTIEESEDFNVEPELPALATVIPEHELRSLKKDERKRQEVINGMTLFAHELFHCTVSILSTSIRVMIHHL